MRIKLALALKFNNKFYLYKFVYLSSFVNQHPINLPTSISASSM